MFLGRRSLFGALLVLSLGGWAFVKTSSEKMPTDITSHGWLLDFYPSDLGSAILKYRAEDQDLISSYFSLDKQEGEALLEKYINMANYAVEFNNAFYLPTELNIYFYVYNSIRR